MSGIAGWIATHAGPLHRPLTGRIFDSIAARGPDHQGSWFGAGAALAHSLFATTTEAVQERQPYSLDGNLQLVADCRIDGRIVLRAKLKAAGRRDVDDAHDAALILHAFHAWGEDCVDHLLGDFSFAIWDPLRRRLFCARDHSGVKPFYYAALQSDFVFSNSLKSVRLHPAVSDQLNHLAVFDFLLFGVNQESHTTIFAGVQSLAPAHCLIWQNGDLTLRRYWRRPIDEPLRYRRPADYVDHFEQIFDEAMRDRLRCPTASVQMSGGLDSTLIAARGLIAARSGLDLRAFSTDFGGLVPDNERLHAQLAADHIGIPIHFAAAADYSLYQQYAETASQLPQPENSPYFLMERHLQQNMAAHSRVSFYGEGADNLLTYEWKPYLTYLCGRRRYLSAIHALTQSFLLDPRIPFAFARRRKAASDGQDGGDLSFPSYLRPEWVTRYDLRHRWHSFWTPITSAHPYHPEAYNAMDSAVWLRLFSLSDPGVSGVALETRHPFLDIRLARFLLALPVIPWCRRKFILRQASRRVLPPAIWQRDKQCLSGKTAPPASALPEIPPAAAEFCHSYVTASPEMTTSSIWEMHLAASPRCLGLWWAAQQKKQNS